jgi:putative ABC transport system permease protein
MKYLPLVWAALWRKPARLILTLLSVSVAFTLFGVMIGFNASVKNVIANSPMDRAGMGARFGGPLPLAYKDQLLKIPGVKNVTAFAGLPGYYRDKKNSAFVLMVDTDAPDVIALDFTLTRAQWAQLAQTRNGLFVSRLNAERYHLKAGDDFPILTAAVTRMDGGKLWPMKVLGVVDDSTYFFGGFMVGNYAFFDEARLLAQHGTVNGYQIQFTNADVAEGAAHDIDVHFANSDKPTSTMTQRDGAERAAAAGINIPFVTTVVAGAGLFMILFLTGNGIAQSVRERIPEFAMLKTLGFSDGGVMALVFIEAAIPCMLGAVIGFGISKAFAAQVPHLFPPNMPSVPAPSMSPAVLGLALVFAVVVAFASAVIPALRIKRLDVAAALTGR